MQPGNQLSKAATSAAPSNLLADTSTRIESADWASKIIQTSGDTVHAYQTRAGTEEYLIFYSLMDFVSVSFTLYVISLVSESHWAGHSAG